MAVVASDSLILACCGGVKCTTPETRLSGRLTSGWIWLRVNTVVWASALMSVQFMCRDATRQVLGASLIWLSGEQSRR